MTFTLELPAPTDPQSDRQRERRLQAAVALYDAQLVSQGSAAELAGLSRAEFMDALSRAGVSAIQYDADEAIEDAARIAAWEAGTIPNAKQ